MTFTIQCDACMAIKAQVAQATWYLVLMEPGRGGVGSDREMHLCAQCWTTLTHTLRKQAAENAA